MPRHPLSLLVAQLLIAVLYHQPNQVQPQQVHPQCLHQRHHPVHLLTQPHNLPHLRHPTAQLPLLGVNLQTISLHPFLLVIRWWKFLQICMIQSGYVIIFLRLQTFLVYDLSSRLFWNQVEEQEMTEINLQLFYVCIEIKIKYSQILHTL